MNKMKLTGIMLLAAICIGVSLPETASAQNVSICIGGICVERDRDGSGVDLRPDFRPPPPHRRPPPRVRPLPPRWPEPVRGYEYLTCESRDQRQRVCYFNPNWVRRVVFDTQHSRAACIPGRTYGIQRDRVWVDHGCRATFQIDRY
jgi:hypothetical protein